MGEPRGIELLWDWTDWSLGIGFNFSSDFPTLFYITVGPFNLSVQKLRYWKRAATAPAQTKGDE